MNKIWLNWLKKLLAINLCWFLIISLAVSNIQASSHVTVPNQLVSCISYKSFLKPVFSLLCSELKKQNVQRDTSWYKRPDVAENVTLDKIDPRLWELQPTSLSLYVWRNVYSAGFDLFMGFADNNKNAEHHHPLNCSGGVWLRTV